ncbi:palmitoyltransferase ZDHHC1-like isoform X2 [Mobula birostris]|uniref:palmitoyltransferase ZDHHC1-like isoform X2 n=1 Tax=Mobula birostris TaxID=1983395 RepID=UPI003B282E66
MEGSETAPEENRRTGRRCTPRRPKINGWSWPPHPYQILAWTAYLYFLIVVVGVLIPLLPRHWIPAGYIYFGAAFTWHLAFYVIATIIDPADDSVRAKGYKKLPPVFRHRAHKTSIRNRYCLLCEVDVGKKSKHCKKCNKCVCNFDHHCKWLNNCVGSRNYRYFLNCVIIALLGSVVIVIISGFVLVAFFINPNLLRSNPKFESVNDANTWLAFLPYFSVRISVPTLLVLAVVTIGLSLIALIALCYLLFFHSYLMWNRLSTYEYILLHSQHQRSEVSPQNDDVDAPRLRVIQRIKNMASRQKGSVHVHFESTSTNGSGSENHGGGFRIEDKILPTVPSNHKQVKLKKKRRRKMAAGRIRHKAAICTTKGPFPPSQLPPALAAAFQTSVLSLQTFPSMDYLSALSMSTVRSVQAAGPPGEYHSDSAESMNEIPVVQTKLGSAAVAMQTSTTFHNTEDSFGNSLQNVISKEHHKKTPDQPTTSKKSKGLDPRDQPVNDRHKSDEMPLPE